MLQLFVVRTFFLQILDSIHFTGIKFGYFVKTFAFTNFWCN